MKIDKKIIKELSEYLDEFNLTEIEYTEKDTKIKVSKNNESINNQNVPVSQNNISKLSNENTNQKTNSRKEITLSLIHISEPTRL